MTLLAFPTDWNMTSEVSCPNGELFTRYSLQNCSAGPATVPPVPKILQTPTILSEKASVTCGTRDFPALDPLFHVVTNALCV